MCSHIIDWDVTGEYVFALTATQPPLAAKPLEWAPGALKALQSLEPDVKQDFGFNLRLIQQGKEPGWFKPLAGFGPRVYELLVNHDTDTYRCVYTIRFEKAVYVVDAFKKKSKRGSEIPKEDDERIRARLKAAEADYKTRYEKENRDGTSGKAPRTRRSR